jgi:hypothetical protein
MSTPASRTARALTRDSVGERVGVAEHRLDIGGPGEHPHVEGWRVAHGGQPGQLRVRVGEVHRIERIEAVVNRARPGDGLGRHGNSLVHPAPSMTRDTSAVKRTVLG